MPNWRRVIGQRPYWHDKDLTNDERIKRIVFEPTGEGPKKKEWAIEQNALRMKRLKEAENAAKLAAEKAAQPRKSWWFSSGEKSASVAPMPTPTSGSPLNIGAPLSQSAAPPPRSKVQELLNVALAKRKAKNNARGKANRTQSIKNLWTKKGQEEIEEVKHSFWSPSTWFSPQPRARTFKNTTPITNNRLRLGTTTMRKLATNASAIGNKVNRRLKNIHSPPASMDFSDYVAVMFDKENKFTLDEKVERFKQIFLLIEIFEGHRTIEETTGGWGKNVFLDPKKSIINMFYHMPSQWWRRYFSGRTNATSVGTGIRIVCAVVGAPLQILLNIPLLAGALIVVPSSKEYDVTSIKDLILVLKQLLETGRTLNLEAHDTAKLLVTQGRLAVAITEVEKEQKQGRERLEILIKAAVRDRYPEIIGKPENEQGKIYAALKYLEDQKDDDLEDEETIVNGAVEVASKTRDDAPDPRMTTELALAVKEADDAAAIEAAEEQENMAISNLVNPLANSIIRNSVSFNTEIFNLAKIMHKKKMDTASIIKRILMLKQPIQNVFNNLQLNTNPIKILTIVYCVKDINALITADVEPAEQEITAQIARAGDKVIRAVTVANIAAGGPDVKNAAKLGAATAVTAGKESLAIDAGAAAAAAAARGTAIDDAINRVLNPLDAAAAEAEAEAAAEEEAAEAQALAAAEAQGLAAKKAADAKKRAEDARAAAAAARAGVPPAAAAPGGGSRHKKRTHKRR